MNEGTLQDASRFDELLVQLTAPKEAAHKRWIRRAIWFGSLAFMAMGAAFFVFFVWEFTSVFIVRHPADMSFAEFCGHFGEAAGGAINLMGLGGLIYSLLFVAEQVKGEKEARLQQDMPVVFVAPRLAWTLGGASERELQERDLKLYVGFRNTSNSAATRLEFRIPELVFRSTDAKANAQFILNSEEKLIDNLPGQEVTGVVNGSDNYHLSMEWPLKEKCPGLLDAIFHHSSPDAEFPSLEMRFSVSFRTIRGAPFFSFGSAVWSPKHCREVKDNKQPNFLNDFAAARMKFEKGQVGLDKFFQGAEENPLVPTITVIEDKEN